MDAISSEHLNHAGAVPRQDPHDEILRRWLDATPEIKAARREFREAVARLPWWAQPGPKSINSAGECFDDVSWVPALQEFRLPEGSVRRTIRPGEQDFRRHYENPPFGSPQRAAEILKRCLDGLAEREAAQDEEQKKAGVSAARRRLHSITLRQYRIRDELMALGPCPARLVFRHLDTIIDSANGDLSFGKQWDDQSVATYHRGFMEEKRAITELLPILPPLFRATCERAIKPGAGPMRKWPYWLGRELPYEGGGLPPPEMIAGLLAARQQAEAA